jgi:hypothetical protein
MRTDRTVADITRIYSTEYGECRDCKAAIMWRWNDKSPPRKMIINSDPDPQGNIVPKMDGTVHVLTKGEMALLSPEVTRYTDHHVTCPDRDKWKGKRRG